MRARSFLRSIISPRRQPAPVPRLVRVDHWPSAVYAIGDVHGCYQQLLALERAIVRDAATISGEKWVVTLGDYVDRGPDSALVVDHLLSDHLGDMPRLSLQGNHEAMLLDHMQNPDLSRQWLDNGGLATLASYAEQNATREPTIPTAHLEFLADLPRALLLPGIVFVHAGIRPGTAIAKQSEQDLMWIREPFLSAQNLMPRVIHGHTPATDPTITGSRIGVDTAAYATGVLTAVRVGRGPGVRFINSDGAVRDVDWPAP